MFPSVIFDKNALQGRVAVVTGALVSTRVGAYGPTKAGLRALTHQMAVEWGPRGIRANSLSPGMIRTPLSKKHYTDEATLRSRISRIPARRLGRPEDIGDVVCFVASDAATYINRQDIVVDGGFLKASLSNLYNNTDVTRLAGGASQTGV